MCGIRCFPFFPASFASVPSYLISITFPSTSPGLFSFLFSLLSFFFVCFFLKILFLSASLVRSLSLSLPSSPAPLCSVKYEDPQALGSLASALDVRQQNAGGVSALTHAPPHRFPPAPVAPPVTSRVRWCAPLCAAVCSTVTFVLRAAITKPWTNRKKSLAVGGWSSACVLPK